MHKVFIQDSVANCYMNNIRIAIVGAADLILIVSDEIGIVFSIIEEANFRTIILVYRTLHILISTIR